MTQIRVRAGNANLDGLEVVIEGWNAKREPLQPMVFQCLPQVQGTAILTAYEALDTKAASAVYQFLQSALQPEEEERFNRIIHGKEVIVDFQALMNLLQDLVVEYTQNPSRRPTDLPSGTSPTAPTSPAAASGWANPVPPSYPPVNSAVPSIQ